MQLSADKMTIVVTGLGLMASGIFHFWCKIKELKHQRFLAYHGLIDDLVDSGEPKADRQIAIIFELRNFKDYHEVTIRTLEGLKIFWGKSEKLTTEVKRQLLAEIDHTIKYCEAGWKARICRKIGLWHC